MRPPVAEHRLPSNEKSTKSLNLLLGVASALFFLGGLTLFLLDI
jgi:hypothetical protein